MIIIIGAAILALIAVASVGVCAAEAIIKAKEYMEGPEDEDRTGRH
jgi:hypothetical protein